MTIYANVKHLTQLQDILYIRKTIHASIRHLGMSETDLIQLFQKLFLNFSANFLNRGSSEEKQRF